MFIYLFIQHLLSLSSVAGTVLDVGNKKIKDTTPPVSTLVEEMGIKKYIIIRTQSYSGDVYNRRAVPLSARQLSSSW